MRGSISHDRGLERRRVSRHLERYRTGIITPLAMLLSAAYGESLRECARQGKYVQAIYHRYRHAGRRETRRILDELCHGRKHAIRLLNGPAPGAARPPRRRAATYRTSATSWATCATIARPRGRRFTPSIAASCGSSRISSCPPSSAQGAGRQPGPPSVRCAPHSVGACPGQPGGQPGGRRAARAAVAASRSLRARPGDRRQTRAHLHAGQPSPSTRRPRRRDPTPVRPPAAPQAAEHQAEGPGHLLATRAAGTI
jgi:hypothetical protein